jgi:hypothetical protein
MTNNQLYGQTLNSLPYDKHTNKETDNYRKKEGETNTCFNRPVNTGLSAKGSL